MAKATPKPKTAFNARSTFVLGISLGSQSHEGDSLAAIVSAINDGSFSKGVIDLSDTLKRYKYMADGMDGVSAAKLAKAEGDAWLARNGFLLDRLEVKELDIRRWDEWLAHPHYAHTRQLFEHIFRSCEVLRDAVDRDIRGFYARAYGESEDIAPQAYELSRQFFLEELAAHSLLYAEYNAVNVYPGKQLECFKVIRQGLVPDAPQALVSSPYAKLVMHSFEHARTKHPFQQSQAVA